MLKANIDQLGKKIQCQKSYETRIYIQLYWYPNSSFIKDSVSGTLKNIRTSEGTLWNEVTENYLVLKRYDLSLNDLQMMDWKMTYP